MTSSFLTIFLLLASVAAQSPEPSQPPSSGTYLAPGPDFAPSGSTDFAPGPGVGGDDCTTYLVNVADCLTYVEAGSNLKEPDKPCCGELAELVKDHPLCLCQLLSNSTGTFGIEIDIPRALKLQNICKIDAPSVSLCSIAGYPIPGVPTSSPSRMSPGMSPGVAPSSETEKGDNAAYGIQFSNLPFFLVCLAIALYLPMFFSS